MGNGHCDCVGACVEALGELASNAEAGDGISAIATQVNATYTVGVLHDGAFTPLDELDDDEQYAAFIAACEIAGIDTDELEGANEDLREFYAELIDGEQAASIATLLAGELGIDIGDVEDAGDHD